MDYTKKRWAVLIACCLVNLCIGSLYAWSVFAGPLLEKFNSLGVCDVAEIGFENVVKSLEQAFVHELVEESHLLGSVLEHVGNDVLDHRLHDLHVALQVAESHLRLDHPELGCVACRV